METLKATFEERLQEIEAYLELLETLERQVGKEGAPKIGDVLITSQQQKILYSAVYLQLYNLVEATVTWCLEAVCAATAKNENWFPGDLTSEIRREWIKITAKTHVDLAPENRLANSVMMCDRLVQSLPISKWNIERKNSGNWDDKAIETLMSRLGCRLQCPPEVIKGVKKFVRDEQGPLTLVKTFRNSLAHGSLSFSECGDGVSVRELRELKQNIADFLREVVSAFSSFITLHEFLVPERRPEGSVAT